MKLLPLLVIAGVSSVTAQETFPIVQTGVVQTGVVPSAVVQTGVEQIDVSTDGATGLTEQTTGTGQTGAVQTSSAAPQDYTLAYKKSVDEEKPLMVVVGAEWCPACQVLKDTTIKSMEASGELDNVSVALVDKDRQPSLAAELTRGERLIPQIILFSKDTQGRWQRRKLTGFQQAQPIRSLIRRAVSLGRRG